MGEVLTWLSNNPIILTLLIVTASLLVIFFIAVASVAIIQGRSVTFWPPQIGEKPKSEKEKQEKNPQSNEIKKDSSLQTLESAKNTVQTSSFECNWTSPHPIAKQILQDAENMVLIVGTSLHRIVHSDFFEYREWIEKKPSRYIGLMFLNPHSPHAVGRKRKDVFRSSDEKIIEAMRLALIESNHNPRILIAVHDGPFRYTARATDIGSQTTTNGSRIQIVSSSHVRGISTGFEVILTPSSGEPYKYYENELAEIWKQSVANIPGHGISVVAKNDMPIEWEILDEFSANLIQVLGDKRIELYPFSPEQHHLTLSSLCRTQLDFIGEPLSISRNNNENSLPLHFEEFLSAVYQLAQEIRKNPTTIAFDKIVLDKHGYYSLAMNKADDLPTSLTEFPKKIRDLVDTFASKYPNENWNSYDKQRKGFRFGSKSNSFNPHVTLGMAFKRDNSFPLPLEGVDTSLMLNKPFHFRLENLIIGHYAYRSYFRTVGEVHVGLQAFDNPLKMLFLLGVGIPSTPQ